MRQHVVVLLRRAPYGRVHVPEGLRAARGVAAGFDRHRVTAVFTQDAVYAAREAVDREALNLTDSIAELLGDGGRLVVDAAAMVERGVDADEIADDVEVLEGTEIAQLIADADRNLDF